MSKQILRSTIHQSFAKTVINEVLSKTSRYYFTFGKSDQWNSDEKPEDALDNFSYENQVRKNFIFAKEIQQNDVSLVIDRKNWVSGVIYDDFDYYSETNIAYSGATNLYSSNFYVLTDEYNVYKCLYNNNKTTSTVKPTGTSSREFTTQDGYVWKYMYSIPTYLQNKFISSTQMPVLNAVNLQYYSNGKLEKFVIDSSGSNYTPNKQLDGTVQSNINNRRELITTSNLTTYIQSDDLIMVDNQVRKVSSVTPSKVIISDDDFILNIVNPSSIFKINTYIDISGDGYSEKNPYIVTGVTIANGGSGYVSANDVLVDFSDPDLPNGVKPKAHVELIGGVISKVIIDENGFGYSKAPSIIITGQSGGIGFSGKVTTTKSKAYIEPVIDLTTGEIKNIQPLDSGIGYSQTNIIVRRLDGSVGNTAIIKANTDIGKINTQQANVELSSIDGGIHIIKVRVNGVGYNSATIKITGDGVGCTAEANISPNGEITSINVTNVGTGYSWANVEISTAETPSVVCVAEAIISPLGGHGSSAIDELFARTIMFRTSLKEITSNDLKIDTNIRQVCLVKNLRQFESNLSFQNFEGSFCHNIEVDILNKPPLQTLEINSIVTIYETPQSNNYVRCRLISKSENSILVKALDNNDENIKIGGFLKHPNQNLFYQITNIKRPNIDMQSGECIFIDNKNPFKPTEEQQITILSRLKV